MTRRATPPSNAGPPAIVRVEGLDDRLAPSAANLLSGTATQILFAPAIVSGSAVPAPESVAFSGPILGIPTGLADGRSATVIFQDGTSRPGTVEDLGDGRSQIRVARDLPLAGLLTGEVRLANSTGAIVLGFQVTVAVDAASAQPQAVVQSTPTYSRTADAVPPAPANPPPAPALPPPAPPSPNPRPAASIAFANFEAGPSRAAYEFDSIRGVRSTVPLPNAAPISISIGRYELGYNFLRSNAPNPLDRPPEPFRTYGEPTPESPRRAFASIDRTRADENRAAPISHGTALAEAEPAEYSATVRELLESIALEGAGNAIWMDEPDRMVEPADRRPYWFLAALVGLGAGQYFRGRGDKTTVEWI